MNFWEAFNYVKETFMKADVSDYKGHLALQVNLTGSGEGKFYAELKDGTLSVEPYEYFDRDVLFTVKTEEFIKIIEGKLDPVTAFTIGKLKVDGDLGKALEIQRLIEQA